MALGRSTEMISKIKWIRTSRLSMKNSLSWMGADPRPKTQVFKKHRRVLFSHPDQVESQPSTHNPHPQPSTLTLNPKPQTPNPKPSTRNPKP